MYDLCWLDVTNEKVAEETSCEADPYLQVFFSFFPKDSASTRSMPQGPTKVFLQFHDSALNSFW